MATLEQLIAQRNELDQQIAAAQQASRTEAIEKVRQIMEAAGLSLADLSQRVATSKPGAKAGARKVAAKYRNTDTGESWSGRGLKPKWLAAALNAGKKIEDFAV